MRPVRDLFKLKRLANRRLLFLRGMAQACTNPPGSEGDRIISFVAIETLNLWAVFARAYYLSCVLGARRAGGVRVTLAVRAAQTVAQAIDFSIRTLKPGLRKRPPWVRIDEPTWHEPRTLMVLSQALGFSHVPIIHAAFAYPTRTFGDLPAFRNFYAHRNDDTFRKAVGLARHYGLSTQLRPSEILVSHTPGRPQSVLAEWIDDIRYVSDSLCQ